MDHETTITLNSDQLPEIKDWKVGEKYSLCLDVEQSSMRIGDMFDMPMGGGSKAQNDLVTATFKVKAVSVDQQDANEPENATEASGPGASFHEEYADRRSMSAK